MRILILSAALAASLAGCADFQHAVDVAVASAPMVNADVQAVATLTATLLDQVAAANPNSAKVQSAVASVKKGNAIGAAQAATLAAYLPTVGVLVDSGALIGKSIGATVATK